MMGAPSPFAATLGIVAEPGADGPTLRLPFGDHLLGRPGFLHGGLIAGLLEIAAVACLRQAMAEEAAQLSLITITVDYLRGGRTLETFAAARAARIGGRIANMTARAWQDDPERPIATARLNLLIVRGAG